MTGQGLGRARPRFEPHAQVGARGRQWLASGLHARAGLSLLAALPLLQGELAKIGPRVFCVWLQHGCLHEIKITHMRMSRNEIARRFPQEGDPVSFETQRWARGAVAVMHYGRVQRATRRFRREIMSWAYGRPGTRRDRLTCARTVRRACRRCLRHIRQDASVASTAYQARR
jgi:hypothetical protein